MPPPSLSSTPSSANQVTKAALPSLVTAWANSPSSWKRRSFPDFWSVANNGVENRRASRAKATRLKGVPFMVGALRALTDAKPETTGYTGLHGETRGELMGEDGRCSTLVLPALHFSRLLSEVEADHHGVHRVARGQITASGFRSSSLARS